MTASFVAVLPAIDPAAAGECLGTMHPRLVDRLVLVDNCGRLYDWLHRYPRWLEPFYGVNRGVPMSWNLGVDQMLRGDAGWLIIISHSIRFGLAGGLDLIDKLDCGEPWIVGTQHGWKCIALSRQLLETVGRFDPIFSPAYREDTDYLYRMALAGLPSPRENGGDLTQFDLDATSTGDGRTVLAKLVTIDWQANLDTYVRKWGADQGAETFTTPYDDEHLDWTFVGEYTPARTGGR